MRRENKNWTNGSWRPTKTTRGRPRRPKPAFLPDGKASPRTYPPRRATLRFSPTAWAKLLFVRDLGDSEVGGFGITACEDLLFVEDFRLVRQASTGASVAFEDQAVADFFDHEVDRGLRPEQFARIWIHTHPGNWAEPSPVDEATFRRVFARTDWAVMAILAREGRTYARLRFEVGPGSQLEIPVGVDYGRPFPATDHEAWREEYEANVHAQPGLALELARRVGRRRALEALRRGCRRARRVARLLRRSSRGQGAQPWKRPLTATQGSKTSCPERG